MVQTSFASIVNQFHFLKLNELVHMKSQRTQHRSRIYIYHVVTNRDYTHYILHNEIKYSLGSQHQQFFKIFLGTKRVLIYDQTASNINRKT